METKAMDSERMQESLDRIFELGQISAIERVARECATLAGEHYAKWEDQSAAFYRNIAGVYKIDAAKLREAYNQKRKAV